MYVAALRLAPLALVQSIVASGVAVLAFVTARGHPGRLARRERIAVVLALIGLVLLGLSLIGKDTHDHHPPALGIIVWLAACGAAAAVLILVPTHFGRAASLGLATGLLFAIGDISAKLIGYGGAWLIALVSLIIGYGLGTSVLQSAYQKGDALTAAGTATIVTNAVPIVAGFLLFGETLPHGIRAVAQITAIACLIASAVFLGRQDAPSARLADEALATTGPPRPLPAPSLTKGGDFPRPWSSSAGAQRPARPANRKCRTPVMESGWKPSRRPPPGRSGRRSRCRGRGGRAERVAQGGRKSLANVGGTGIPLRSSTV